MQRFAINHHPVQTLLSWIKADQIAIPEIQRPFVWNSAKVRDFIDSLYNGYPVGYLIAWQNPDVRLKDGTHSTGKRILIDGQQRVTALLAALLGEEVINKNYKKSRITISFHPRDERFEVANNAIRKDTGWIPDIATIFAPNMKTYRFVGKYCEANPDADEEVIHESVARLLNIRQISIGLIDLDPELDVETVAEIFVRVNSQGVPLNAADFAMSKMAAGEKYDGHRLRKCIDYFCHLAVAPDAYNDLAQDSDFAGTDYFRAMEWLKDEKDDLYDPSYTDMLRVAFTSEFKRGRLDDLVALLAGRDFESRTFQEDIAEDTFRRLKVGILGFMKKSSFTQFVMVLRSAGFIDSSLIRSQNAVNFAYILYLTLRAQHAPAAQIQSLVRRWFVMSVLIGRYTGSPETAFGVDIRNISSQGAEQYLGAIEKAVLSDTFWNVGLPQQMDTSVASSPYFNVFLASQVKANDKGFLSRDLTVRDLLEGQRDIHHVFPRSYLRDKHHFPPRRYNQIANYVVMQKEINIAIGGKCPTKYFTELQEQCKGGPNLYGGITDAAQLRENLAEHCLPHGMESARVESYDAFLHERRSRMATKIRDYYKSL